MSAPRVLVRTLVEAPLRGDVLLLDGVRAVRVEDPVRRRQCDDERVQDDVEARRGAAEGRFRRRAAEQVRAVGGDAPE